MSGLDYRCYPPPARFTRRYGAAHLRNWLRQGNEEPIPASLSLALHLPDGAAARCCGLIASEIELLGILVDSDRRIDAAWWDIGAGSTCSEVDLARVNATLRHSFAAYPPATTRVVLPEPLPGMLIGAALDRLLRRLDTAGLWVRIGALDAPKASGPGVATAARLRDGDPHLEGIEFVCRRGEHPALPPPGTVERWLELAPHRVILRDASLPADAGDAATHRAHERALSALATTIVAHGYVELGFEEYAQGESALAAAFRGERMHLTLQGYAAEPEGDRLGLGPGAITRVGDCYAANARMPDEYEAALAGGSLPVVAGHEPADDDRLRGAMIIGLATVGRVDYATLGERFGIDALAYFTRELARLAPLEAAGLVATTGTGIALRPGARRWLRQVCAAFDRYVAAPAWDLLVASTGLTGPARHP